MKFTAYTNHTFRKTAYYATMPEEEREVFDILSTIFHFKVNSHVCENLVNWRDVPNDPVYRYVFPRKEMLSDEDFNFLRELFHNKFDSEIRDHFVEQIQKKMRPRHSFIDNSLPKINGKAIHGMYSNFPTIVSLAPNPMAKTCHAYCSYCFRWIMFGDGEIQRNSSYDDPEAPVPWLLEHPEVTDVLFTGADPMVLSAGVMQKFIDPVLDVDSVDVIRISSKALAYWPYCFTTDKDADNLLRLFEYIQSHGKHLNFCAHFTHPRELDHPEVEKAVQRIRETGAVIRTQGPLIRGVNDDPETWSEMWSRQVALGMVPYYMFMEADHHPQSCFRVAPAKALQIFQEAQKTTTGLARTVRGPVFMYDLNRVLLDGTTEINGNKYFVLKTLQSPPDTQSEGMIKLVPYDETAMDLGNLYKLFNDPVPMILSH
jgi:L-lysine 2,3-aminomutase